MRLAITLAFAFALTAPAIAATTPSAPPKATAAPVQRDLAAQIGAALHSIADQSEAAVRQIEGAAARQQQAFNTFYVSVYAPVCSGHKGLLADPKISAVTRANPGQAWPATVRCADGTSSEITAP